MAAVYTPPLDDAPALTVRYAPVRNSSGRIPYPLLHISNLRTYNNRSLQQHVCPRGTLLPLT